MVELYGVNDVERLIGQLLVIKTYRRPDEKD